MYKGSRIRLQQVCLFISFSLLFSTPLHAVNKYWISNVSSVWSNPANWSPAGVPGPNDFVYFNSSGLGACNLDVNATVGYFEMTAGTFNKGTFSFNVIAPGIPPASLLANAMVINGGTFNGGSNLSLYVSGGFKLLSGTFNCPSPGLFYSVGDTFIHAGGAFNAGSGKVVLNTGSASKKFFYGNGTTTFYQLDFNAIGLSANEYYLNDNITVLDTCWKSGNNSNRIWGPTDSIFLKGSLMITYQGSQGYGDANFVFNGTGGQTIAGLLPTYRDSWIENVYVDKPSDTLHVVNYFLVGPDWIYRRGVIDAKPSSTVFFWGSGTIDGTFALHNVRFYATYTVQYRKILDTLTVKGYLEIIGNNYTDIYDGYLRALGNIYITATAGGNTFCGGDAYIWINGTNDQIFDGDCRRTLGFIPNVIIDKPSGTLTIKDTITTERSWEYRRGIVDAISGNSYINFAYNAFAPTINNPTPTPRPDSYFIDGEENGNYMLFNKVEIQQNRKLNGDVHIKNKLILNSNLLVLNGYDLYFENSDPNMIQTTGGSIISETSSPPSSIYWYIDNRSAGTSYTFPFTAINVTPSLSYPLIFFDLSIQTPGVPNAGDTGWISVATYPTDPYQPVNNRPLPPGVTNLTNQYGFENAPRELDRFWVYDCGNYATKPAVSMTFRYRDQEWNAGNNQITETKMRPHQWNESTLRWGNPTGGTLDAANNISTINNVTSCSAFTLVDTTIFVQIIFHASDTNICKGETIQFFDDNPTPPPGGRVWTFQGGIPATDTSRNPFVTYNSTGNFRAILKSTYATVLSDTIYIHVKDSFTVSYSHTNVSCLGDNNGTINLTVTPAGVYRYSWSDGDTISEDRTGLAAGTYTVTVSDTIPDGCFKVRTIIITQPNDSLTVTIDNIVNATCTCNGKARANASGGAGGYTYLWSSGDTNQTATSLCPGSNFVTVTDANGCSIASDSIVIIGGANPLLVPITSKTDVSCAGRCDGRATVTPSGGTGPYTYSWSCWGQITQTAVNLCAGICEVTVTDAAGCTATGDTVIIEPDSIILTVRGYDVSAFGANDGRVRAIVTGGNPPYFLTHYPDCSPGCRLDTLILPQDSIDRLSAGQFCFNAFDFRGCRSDTVCVTISEPIPPLTIASINKTNVTCAGANNGMAWVIASGGTGGYSYSWSSGTNRTNDTVTGLSAGIVTVTVYDSGGNSVSGSVTITAPPGSPVTYNFGIRYPTCNGGCDGSAWIIDLAGGTAPFTYNWNTGSANDTITNVCAGIYYVTVTDSAGCSKNDTVQVDEPPPFSVSQTITPVSCPGGSNGAISLNVTGSNGFGYGYRWSTGANSASVNGLREGFYSVIVNDALGCTATESYNVQVGTRFEISANVINASCGNNDGSIDITVLSGSGSYNYTWSNASQTQDISGLSADEYTVTVTSGTCTQTLTAIVENSGGPTVTGTVIKATDCSSSDGSISLTVTNGTGAYSYAWSHGSFNSSTVTNLSRGTYTVTVTDDTTSCISISTFDVGVLNEITISAMVTDATCGANDGAISLTVLTGTMPYTFNWSTGATTQNVTGLGFGTYLVTVSDSKGCVGDSMFTVSEGGPAISGTVTNVSCFSGNNGAINITVSGTNLFSWSNGQTTQNISNLQPGIYTVTVTASTSQCSSARAFTVDEPAPFTLTADLSGISCFGWNDGWIDLTVSGGNQPYTYTWTGPSFTNSLQDIYNLYPGAYNVISTDSKGCTSSLSSIQITEPFPIVLDLDTVPVSCGGLSDGQASVTVVSGGVGPFTYLWSGGIPNDSSVVSGLTAGPISIVVTDANTCTQTGATVITEPPPLSLVLHKTDITCYGANDGKAGAHPSGGTPGFSYSWSPGTPIGVGDSVTSLASGYVTVTVTDNNSCSIIDSIFIDEPQPLATTVTATTPVSCFGGSDGRARVVASGGRLPYTYSWSQGTPPLNNDSVTGLPQGITRVTVTDFSGCSKTDSVTLSQPATPITTTMVSTDVSCYGGDNGTATVTASGGTPGYRYSWTAGIPGNTASVTQLAFGNAIVTVTDSNGCQAKDTAFISQPSDILITTANVGISCFGANDGKAFVTSVTGGTPGNVTPYTYLWSTGTPPLTLDSVIGLGPGTVTVTVSDSIGCTRTATENIIEPAPLQLNIQKLDISCFGRTDGKAWVVVSGGTPGTTGYIYSWSGGSPGVTPDTTKNLPQGLVSVTVTDSRSCSDSANTTITEPSQITVSIRHTDVLCFGGNDGTAKVIPSGGTPGYTYTWSRGTPISPDDSVTALSQGPVCVTVNDFRQCPASICDTIIQPATALTITSIAKTDVLCHEDSTGTATVAATGGTPTYTYTWSGGSAGANPESRINLPAGTVNVTVTDANGCPKDTFIAITQPDELILTIRVDSNANCNGGTNGGLTVSLTGGTPTYDYVWSTVPQQQLLNTTQDSFSVAGLGVGAYTVSVTDANSCLKTISGNIGERPGPQIAANGVAIQRPTCDRSDGSISITVTSQDLPLSYIWTPSTPGTGDNPRMGLPEGTYTVRISDASTCDTTLPPIILSDIPGPIINPFIKIKDSYCDDYDGRATAVIIGGTPPFSFTWYDDNNIAVSTDSVVQDLDPGNYSVTITDANSCPWDTTFTIINIASPNAQISPVSPRVIYEGQSVAIIATSDIPTSKFLWEPVSGLSCGNCDTLTATPRSTITYTLHVKDSLTQCPDTAYFTIIVKDEKNIFVPNVITPNGDAVNDRWNIADLLEVFPDNEVVIVNRWGDEVFRAKAYGTSDENTWDGFYKGEKLPDGTYYYIIKLNNINKSVTGPVTIISE